MVETTIPPLPASRTKEWNRERERSERARFVPQETSNVSFPTDLTPFFSLSLFVFESIRNYLNFFIGGMRTLTHQSSFDEWPRWHEYIYCENNDYEYVRECWEREEWERQGSLSQREGYFMAQSKLLNNDEKFLIAVAAPSISAFVWGGSEMKSQTIDLRSNL